jgi:hypothetical protein
VCFVVHKTTSKLECTILTTLYFVGAENTYNSDANDPPPFIHSNEIVLNVEPLSESIHVGDVVADVRKILGVDPQPIIDVALIEDEPSIVTESMAEYNAVFGDERAEDSANDHLVLELSNRDMVLLQRVLAEHAANVLECWDSVVPNGLKLDDSVLSLIMTMSLCVRVLYLKPWRK